MKYAIFCVGENSLAAFCTGVEQAGIIKKIFYLC
jgi:hypothetical protein